MGRSRLLQQVVLVLMLMPFVLVATPAQSTHVKCFGLYVPHDSEHLGTANQDYLDGDGGNDVMHGLANPNTAPDHLQGHGGDDKMCGGENYDVMGGGTGNDKMSGGPYDDTIEGEGGNDTIKGGDRHDDLFGEDGNDQIWDGRGEDWLSGGAGTDTVYLCTDGVLERHIVGFENIYTTGEC